MVYYRRIAFVISDQHLIPHGGIGSFAKTFFDMSQTLSWKCDFILDKKPRDSSLLDYLKQAGANFYYPPEPLTYSGHQSKFVFSDSLNFEKVINFRNALLKAYENNLYDMILINTPEAGPATYIGDLFQYIPICFYTHNENVVFMDTKSSNVFNQAFDDITKSMMSWPNMKVGTQSQRNVDSIRKATGLTDQVNLLPMRIPESQLLEPNLPWAEKHGMLFIGRYEPRKNPEAFVAAAKATGFKPLILTNSAGKEKFEKDFSDQGIDDYDIRVSIIGQEKVDFIKSARIAYHPSKLESYGFCAFESLHSCPTFALEEYGWHEGFGGMVHALQRNDVIDVLKRAYAEPELFYTNTLERLLQWDSEIPEIWDNFVQDSQRVNLSDIRETKVVELIKQGQISMNDLVFKGLARKHLAVDDIQSIYAKRHLFKVYQTDSGTYFSTSDFKEEQPSTFDDLFG